MDKHMELCTEEKQFLKIATLDYYFVHFWYSFNELHGVLTSQVCPVRLQILTLMRLGTSLSNVKNFEVHLQKSSSATAGRKAKGHLYF